MLNFTKVECVAFFTETLARWGTYTIQENTPSDVVQLYNYKLNSKPSYAHMVIMILTIVTTISIGFVKPFHLLPGVRCLMSHTSNLSGKVLSITFIDGLTGVPEGLCCAMGY